MRLTELLTLTDELPSGKPGEPVLVLGRDKRRAYLPDDLIRIRGSSPQSAASIVERYAGLVIGETRDYAEAFLKQSSPSRKSRIGPLASALESPKPPVTTSRSGKNRMRLPNDSLSVPAPVSST